MPWRPRLWYTHRNFFIGYFTVAVIHLAIGVSSFTSPERYDAKSLDVVFSAAPLAVWAVAHLLVWALMAFGVYHRFNVYGRLGLVLGMMLALMRGLLIEVSKYPPGTGIFLWAGFAVWQFTMASEPTVNPITARMHPREEA